jgi:hypothetical protein
MKKATLVKTLDGFNGDARLYRVDPPLEGNEFVVVSAVFAYSGPETYIFPSDADGEVVSWSELEGSFNDGIGHKEALNNAGYVVGI